MTDLMYLGLVDDLAVLHWIRDQRFSRRTAALKYLGEHLQRQGAYMVAWPDALMFYQVGDYARAALATLVTPESSP